MKGIKIFLDKKKTIHYEQFINFAEGKKQRLVKHIKKYYKMW